MDFNGQEKQNETPQQDQGTHKFNPGILVEVTKPSRKKKRLSLGALFALAVLGKFLIWPTIQTTFYELKHRSGHGWDDSKAEFQKYYLESWTNFGAALPVKYAPDLATCQSNSYVAWLNKSGCRRYRISLLSTASEHEKQTAICLSSAGEAEFVKVSALDCIRQTIPNKWGEFESVFSERTFAALHENQDRLRPEGDNRILANCVAKKYVKKMTKISSKTGPDCGPLNLEANDLDSMLYGGACPQANMKLYTSEFLESCAADVATVAH